jgi:RNA polymerase sigma-70 factor (sigma-E family)
MWAHPEEAVRVVDAREAFEDFARDRSAHLFRLALMLSGWNEAVAQDLLQIALERAYSRRWLLFRDEASAEPYVRRVLVNAAIDWRRALRRRQEQPIDAAEDLGLPDATTLVDDRDLLLRALSVLPSKQRAVLVLRYWEDLSDAEIAAAMNCTVGTVRSQASRALVRLRQQAGAHAAARVRHSKMGEQHE